MPYFLFIAIIHLLYFCHLENIPLKTTLKTIFIIIFAINICNYIDFIITVHPIIFLIVNLFCLYFHNIKI